MSIPDNELDLDKLFLPAWAQEPASANLYAKYEGEERAGDRDRRGARPGRRGPRREGGEQGRPQHPRREGARRDGPGRRGERPSQGGPGAPVADRGRGPRRDRG